MSIKDLSQKLLDNGYSPRVWGNDTKLSVSNKFAWSFTIVAHEDGTYFVWAYFLDVEKYLGRIDYNDLYDTITLDKKW